MAEPTNHELSERIAVLEEKMNTSYERLMADMARRDTDMARRDTEMARRDKDNQRWTVGFGIAQIAITIAVLGAGFAFLALVGIPTK
ncbi:MAG: hypothetical protein OXF20_08265 [Gammaproteobacteria bacterium]|nr:hypothetical protein [Gammaproteobacteria bacterium]